MRKLLVIVQLVCLVGLSKTLGQGSNLHFIENKGQWNSGIDYAVDIQGGKLFLNSNSFNYLFYDTKYLNKKHLESHGISERKDYEHEDSDFFGIHYLKMSFVGASNLSFNAIQKASTRYNYFYGSDSKSWITDVSSFDALSVCELYSGIDLELYSTGNHLKYDLLVAPFADPSVINLAYEGQDEIYEKNGDLYIETSVNTIQELRPYAYQLIGGSKVEIPCRYVLNGDQITFDFPVGYRTDYELIIDPILIFSTYSGSAADNWGNTATFGEEGSLYSGGIANHFRGTDANGNPMFLGTFPVTPGAFQAQWGGVWDVAILKYDSAGTTLKYASYLGGSGAEVPHSLIMNNKNELIIYGTTGSSDFPVTTGSYQENFAGGSTTATILGTSFGSGTDTFIAILSQDGSQLVSSTFLGGLGNDGISPTNSQLTKNYGDQHRGEVFIDADDNVYVAGNTNSTDLFVSDEIQSFDRTYGGGLTDGFAVKLNSDLSSLEWGGYLGGSESDVSLAIKVDQNGNALVAGGTESADFPLPHPSYDSTFNGLIDGYVVKIYETGDSLISGTFLGTNAYDQAYFLDLDADEDVYILGQTRGAYPNTTALSLGRGQFIQKLSQDLESSEFSTTFGSGSSEPNISPTAFLVNDCDNLYVAGWGNNTANFTGNNYVNLNTQGLPTSSDALRQTTSGQDFYLMVLDASANNLLYGTFFGGSQALVHVDGGTSRFDKSGIVYHSVCASCDGTSSFPTTAGAYSTTNLSGSGCNNASYKFDLASLRADFITNTISFDSPGITEVCLGDPIVFENKSIGGQQFEWDFGDGSPEVVKLDTTFIIHEYRNTGTYTVRLRASDPNTCISEDFAFRTVQVTNPNLFVMDDRTICFGDEIRLQASGAFSYEWLSEDSTFTSTERTPLIRPEEDTRYFITLSSGTCSRIDTVDISVIPGVTFDFTVERRFDCWTRPTLELVNNDPGQDVEFSWSLGDGNTVVDEDSYTHNYERDGTYLVSLLAQNDFCIFQESVEVNITTIRVPNVITPTTQGDNDTFIIEAPDQVALKIYNEWGRLVLDEENYQNTWSGKDQSAGIYYYEARVLNNTSCKGWVQLLK